MEWLGQVPQHWEVTRLKWSSGGTINGVWGDEPDGENDIACVRVADFDRRTLRVNLDDPTMRAIGPSQRIGRELRVGDLLLEKSGGGEKQMVGCVVLFDHDEPAVSSNFIARISTVPGGNPKFWTYVHAALYSAKLNNPAIKQTTGIQNLDSSMYFDTLAGFPPPAEQEVIAAFLDRETERIDALVEKKQRLIERLREYRAALITRTVTRGLPPEAARAAGLDLSPRLKPSGVEWLGDVPEHWETLPLKRWVSAKITDGPHETPDLLADGIPFMSAESMVGGRLDFNRRRGFISPEQHEIYSRKCRPQRNDIFMCKSGATTGKVAIVDTADEFSVWSPLALIRVNPQRILAPLMFAVLQARYVQQQVKDRWSYGTQPNLAMEAMERLVVVLPPIHEQRAIAAFLDRETERIDVLVRQVESNIERLREYRTALITAAVTGKIDVREAAREPVAATV